MLHVFTTINLLLPHHAYYRIINGNRKACEIRILITQSIIVTSYQGVPEQNSYKNIGICTELQKYFQNEGYK